MVANSFNSSAEHVLVFDINQEFLNKLTGYVSKEAMVKHALSLPNITETVDEHVILGCVSNNIELIEYMDSDIPKNETTINNLIQKSILNYLNLEIAFDDMLEHPELLEYIEGTCSKETKHEFESYTRIFPKLNNHMQRALNFEKENGKGSFRKNMERAIAKMEETDEIILTKIKEVSMDLS